MSIFRSEEMVLKRIRLPKVGAEEIMNDLGKIDDGIEFVDLTKNDLESQRHYALMIKRCDEIEKKILNFNQILKEFNETSVKYESFKNVMNDVEEDQKRKNKDRSLYFDELENEIIEDERKLRELTNFVNDITDNLELLNEKWAVFDKVSQLVAVNPNLVGVIDGNVPEMQQGPNLSSQRSNLNMEEGIQSDFKFIAGIIKATDELRMKRMIFRLSRARAIPTYFDYPHTEEVKPTDQKKIFTIFFQGGVEGVLLNKLIKICDIFNASRYNIPSRSEMVNELTRLNNEIKEKEKFLQQGNDSVKEFMKDKIGIGSTPGRYEMYRYFFKKEKYIYTNLNKCKLHENFLDGEVWIPAKKWDEVHNATQEIIKRKESNLTANFESLSIENSPTKPPTFIKSNEFTFAFQEIVNTYGTPRYQEINPALFAIVTFPFLFGVMFGDIAHGLLLLLFGSYLCLQKDELVKSKSILVPALKGRYLILLMGIFAFYCGWMYNDFMSLSFPVFGSCYQNGKTEVTIRKPDCTYPFGLDPKWYVAQNELAFINSLKMKLSVILGIFQMTMGICLKGLNNIYFKQTLEFVFEFIPQIIFMVILFGYMILMIFLKWSIDWSGNLDNAPSLITQLMNIFLKLGSVQGKPLWGDGSSQVLINRIILVIAFLCIPIMLFPKPLILYNEIKNKKQQQESSESERNYNMIVEDNNSVIHNDHQGGHEESFGEIFVHQAIETIEFVLGAISNTASYLRLWALSLAHAQLSNVFFEKALLGFIQGDSWVNIIFIFVGFFMFANFTFFVLMCMDLMECFLHTLRLHWVEFQNKFFKADGRPYIPFCFKYLICSEDN